MLNRHGLIAGATGTGQDEDAAADRRAALRRRRPGVRRRRQGRLSGLAEPGAGRRPGGEARDRLGLPSRRPASRRVPVPRRHRPRRAGARDGLATSARSCLAKVLGANETQEQSLALVFRYADEKGLPLLDLADLRALLTFLDPTRQGRAEGHRRHLSPTVGVLLRSLVALEDGGGTEFFGEPQLDVADLLRTAPDGRGIISCLELPAVQDKPKLFSTALMWLLAELFETLPEVGDLDKPKLVFFFDEAHLLFDGATEAFSTRSPKPCG